jgi:DNA-binding response OmpR family regulator
MKVLLIEDDKILGESIKEYLESYNISVTWEMNENEIDQFYNFGYFDLIIIDLMLKFQSGISILRQIRHKHDTPVIISTAKFDITTKEECFLSGADDYLVKPYDPKELYLRINNILRKNLVKTVIVNEVEIDTSTHLVTKNGVEIKLTQKEWQLLLFLLKNRNKVVTTESILNYIWGNEIVGSESVRTYIKRLRDILGENSIETFKGIGYRLR